MESRALQTQIDRLYQLPLDEFTPARNALAKGAGADTARIRALAKPPVAAWAVNQLRWRDQDVWDELIAAAENAQRAHKAVLSGRGGDVRAAGQVHDEAVEKALKATLALLEAAGQPATDATRHAIATTLRALPGDEPPGRLTKTLQPGGFEMLAGLSVGRGRAPKASKPQPVRPAPPPRAKPARDAKALTRARQDVTAAARALREAEQAVRREEFEAARTARDEARAVKTEEQAREALARATSDLQKAEAAVVAARRAREAADTRAREARQAVTAARTRSDSTAADLEKVESG